MKREINFRAWHKSKNLMYTVHYLDLKENCRSVGLMKNQESLRSDDNRDVYLMQFTGLLDKNGIEIYEGDIVQHDAWDYPFEVIFNQEKARFVCKMKAGLTQYIAAESLIVVGNIYEKPEL